MALFLSLLELQHDGPINMIKCSFYLLRKSIIHFTWCRNAQGHISPLYLEKSCIKRRKMFHTVIYPERRLQRERRRKAEKFRARWNMSPIFALINYSTQFPLFIYTFYYVEDFTASHPFPEISTRSLLNYLGINNVTYIFISYSDK